MDLLKGMIDMHIHAAPDVIPRSLNEIELVRKMRLAGMTGVLLKSHHMLTADRAWLIRQIEPNFDVFGSLTLNVPSTGGFNLQAVETAVKLGAKEIWMPTISSAHHLRYEGRDASKGLVVLTRDGEMVPEVLEILNLIADANIILGTGHLSVDECCELVDAARKTGVRKILVTHPEWKMINMPVKVQVELSRKGAFMEHCHYATTKLGGELDPREIAAQIRAVGAEHCVMATDHGNKLISDPIDGMKAYVEEMMNCGISKEEIDRMTKENPTGLLRIH
jgi:hypothetical protein